MTKKDYQQFKCWLLNNEQIHVRSTDKATHTIYSDAIDYLYAYNEFINKHISSNNDIFSLIKNKNYIAIYNFRHHYRVKPRHKETQNILLPLFFNYLNCNYEEYIEFEANRTLSMYSNSNTLFIHSGNIACIKYNHPIEDVYASIVTNLPVPIYIHASRCTKCNIIFIRKEEFLRLRSRYPFLVANFCELSYNGYTPLKDIKLKCESILMLCGYNTRDNGPSEENRQKLLASIIGNEILNKTQIIQYLEHFINFNGSKENMFFAVHKWQNDLNYVRNFNLDTHPYVEIKEIKMYSSR